MTIEPTLQDLAYLKRCYQIARLGGKATKSNPNVGSVIVAHDRIIGEGFHQYYGGPHAEINALKSVVEGEKHKLPSSTIYVSLEPCNHTGKTGPCTNAIIDSGIKRVVVGAKDPNPLVSGAGIDYLRKHGCEVIEVEDREAKALIKPFIVHQQLRPYIFLKWAESQEGYMGSQESQIWLTHARTSILTHKWRSEADGILIGSNTAIVDNPSLDTRHYPGVSPVRIILDSQAKAFKSLKETNSKTIVVNEIIETIESNNTAFVKVDDVHNLEAILSKLFHHGIFYLIVEGGAKVLQSFIDQGYWDEARIIKTQSSIKDGIKAPIVKASLAATYSLASDTIHIFKP